MAKANSIPANVVEAVNTQISHVVETIRGAHDLAEQCAAGNLEGDTLAIAILGMMANAGRTLDACAVKLGGASSGYFDEVFEL